MMLLLVSVLLAAMSLECRAQRDNVLQPAAEETATEGEAVTLGCHYNSTSSNDYLFWYKQHGSSSPTFILSRFKIGTGKTEEEDRFSSTLDSSLRSVPLKIQKLQLSDSAVYYCALRPDVANSKLIFGRGTRLTIETKEVSLPSYYKLEGDHGSVCLATGFNNITYARKENSLFHRTSAVRIRYDKLYNHLAYLSSGNETCETGNTPDVCVDTLKPDPQVNMASLTVLGLRLLFLKTVVFNVLLTLRLWMTS